MKKAGLGMAMAAAQMAGASLVVGLAKEELLTEPPKEGVFDGYKLPEGMPDHLSVDKDSPHFSTIYRHIGVRFNGEECDGDVQEYCVSEGWLLRRVRNDKRQFRIEDGRYVLERVEGDVRPYFKNGYRPAVKAAVSKSDDIIAKARDKQARKAEKRAAAAAAGGWR